MPVGDFTPVPKPKHKRLTKTARQRGEVSKAVYAAAWDRADGRCERCGKDMHDVWTLDAAHVERRWRAPPEGIGPEDILILCGPSVQSDTCHHWADYTREGREWLLQKREELRGAVTHGMD